MGVFTHLPDRDYRNDGWSLVGTAVTRLFEALNNDDDAKYVRAPGSKGQATVRFPVDTSNVPEGAVITSVTVKLRCATGTGSAPSGSAPSITVAVAADDDTSRFITRTITPTSSITTFEIASYKVDPLGLRWDVHRLNHILCKFWCLLGIFDLIRCYKFFCEVNYRVRPTVTVDSPSGTVETPSPVVSWTYTQSDGDPQKRAEFKVFTAVEKNKVSFNPEKSDPVYAGTVDGELTSLTLPTSLNPDQYWVYVRATSSYNAKSVWVGKQFSVTGSSPGSPGLPDDSSAGVALIKVIPDRLNGMAQITLRDTSNMLSAQTADAESPIDSTAVTGSNCTITRSTAESFPGGTASWRLSSSGTSTMALLTDWVEIDPTVPLTARAQFKTAASARSCRVVVSFYDSAFASAGGSLTGTNITDATGTWKEATVTGTPPTGAKYARLEAQVLSPGAGGELHYVDHIGLMYGVDTAYSDGGHTSRNLLSSWYSTCEGSPAAGEAWSGGPGTSVTTAAPIGTGGSGSLCNRMTYQGLSPSIGFRAAGTAFNSATSGTDYTLNKPAGVVSGDLMLAYVTVNSSSATCTPPAGWALVDTVRAGGSTAHTMFVLKRTAGGVDGSSWVDGLVSVACTRRSAVVVAYSGAADAASQPLASTSVGTSNATPLYLTTPTLNNTDPNAWRISAFSVRDNASGGTLTANRQAPSTVPAISFVGVASAWKDTSHNATSYTINRPSGVQSGDLMIAQVLVFSDIAVTVTPPSGWTQLQSASQTSHHVGKQVILYRVAGGSEPSSWSGSLTTGDEVHVKMTQAVAYRNCNTTTPFIDSDILADDNDNDIFTPYVTNTDSRAWRVSMFAAHHDSSAASFTSSDVSERQDTYAEWSGSGGWLKPPSYETITGAMYDSNGPVSTGDTRVNGILSKSTEVINGFVALLNPVAAPPAAVGNETAQAVATVGSSDPWFTTRVFDSGGIIPVGTQSITGIWAPGSGTDLSSMTGWQGIIIPASPVTAGFASATMSSAVDISSMTEEVLDLAGRKIALTTAFIGSVASTPYLAVNFYRANQLLQTVTAEGTPFGTTVWIKSDAVFEIPDGTTRMTVTVSAADLAVSDMVYWDRVSLALGTETTYRPGTSRDVHPVWSRPLIEFADDRGSGYSEFRSLPGSLVATPAYRMLDGLMIYGDHTVIPLTNRKYRARTKSYGLNGDTFVSPLGPESKDFRFVAEKWWLKDILDPSQNVELAVRWEKVNVDKTNTATVFQPLGRNLPIVLSEGFKGDSFTLNLIPVDIEQWGLLRNLIESERTLFLQSDVDDAWWVRCIGDLGRGVLPTAQRRENPLREVKVTFVEVEPIE